jgi:hypothetical protein
MKIHAGRGLRSRCGALLLVLCGVVVAYGSDAAAGNPPNYPTGSIERTYYANGPWAVTAQTAIACCDSSGNHYDVWYPTNLGDHGFQHPIITWGDGTIAVPSQYAMLLSHLASWGFVVIASESQNTGSGQEILDAAQYLVNANNDPSSVFYHKLATGQIGAVGHSQGAGGVVNAMLNGNGLIKTVITMEKPPQMFCSANAPCPSTGNIHQGSVFYINGSSDFLISPSTQFPFLPGEQSNAAFYANTPVNVAKFWATLKGPNHNDVQGQPDCTAVASLCTNGVYGYLGYPTAWLMDRLQGDSYAHGAFTSPGGEIFGETANWTNQIGNIQ